MEGGIGTDFLMLLLPTPDIIDWQAELDGLIELEGTAPRKEGNIGHRTSK